MSVVRAAFGVKPPLERRLFPSGDRPLVAGKGLMGFSLQTCHPVNATVAIGQRGGIRAVGQKQPVAYVRWADCFRLTTDIGTLIKTVAGR